MNQKQQALIKLAQVRLAINHVLRTRAIQKQAAGKPDWDHSDFLNKRFGSKGPEISKPMPYYPDHSSDEMQPQTGQEMVQWIHGAAPYKQSYEKLFKSNAPEFIKRFKTVHPYYEPEVYDQLGENLRQIGTMWDLGMSGYDPNFHPIFDGVEAFPWVADSYHTQPVPQKVSKPYHNREEQNFNRYLKGILRSSDPAGDIQNSLESMREGYDPNGWDNEYSD